MPIDRTRDEYIVNFSFLKPNWINEDLEYQVHYYNQNYMKAFV